MYLSVYHAVVLTPLSYSCIPCGHVYGRSCLERWIKKCKKNAAKVCRYCWSGFRFIGDYDEEYFGSIDNFLTWMIYIAVSTMLCKVQANGND